LKNIYQISDFFTDEEFQNISEEFCPSDWRVNCEDMYFGSCEICWTKYIKSEIKRMLKEKMTLLQISEHFNKTLKEFGVANSNRNSCG